MKIIDWFKDKKKLIDENSTIRKAKNTVENKMLALKTDLNDISAKYTKLLEEKSEKFDLYVKYQNECVEFSNKIREQKKEIATLKEQLKLNTEKRKVPKPRKSIKKDNKSNVKK